jgi:hypothetical protein
MGLLLGLIPGLREFFAGLFGWLNKKEDTRVAVTRSDNESGAAVSQAYMASVNAANEWKAKTRTERIVVFGLIAFASPVALLFWAATLDSLPFYIPYFMDTAHVVGSWGVDIPPKLQVPVEKIIDSFFISAPVVGSAAILARVFK